MGNAAIDSLERMKEESKKATLKLVDMECNYLTVDFFRKLPQDIEKGGNPAQSIFDRYNDSYLRRIGKLGYIFINLFSKLYLRREKISGSTVLSYVNMVCATLRHSIPKSIVYGQVREAKRALLDHFFTELGKKEVVSLSLSLSHSPSPPCISASVCPSLAFHEMAVCCRLSSYLLCWMRTPRSWRGERLWLRGLSCTEALKLR